MKKTRRKVQKVQPDPQAVGPSQTIALLQHLDRKLGSACGWWGVLLLIAVVAFGLGVWTFDQKLGLSGDNTEFITLARSLSRGQGLSYINLPTPQPATKFPFGFPLMLVPLEWLFPGQWVPMKWMVLVLYAASMPVFFALVQNQLGRLPALLAVMFCLTHPLLLDYAHQVMSEIPYLLFFLLSLFLFERALQGSEAARKRRFIAAFCCMMAAYYIRSAGLILVAAVVFYLLFGGHHRRALKVGIAALLAGLPWELRNRAIGGGGGYFEQLMLVNPYFSEQGKLGLASGLARLSSNTQLYLKEILPRLVWSSLPSSKWLFTLVSLALLGLGVYATILCLRRRQHLLLWLYAGLFSGLLLVWPWTGDRFFLPILPVGIFFAVRVGMDIMERLDRAGKWGRKAGRLAVAAVFLLLLADHAGALQALAQAGRGDYPPAWRNFYAAGQWLKAHTPEEALISCRKSYWLYIVSERMCSVYPFKSPPEVIEYLDREGVDFVVAEQLGFSSTPRFLLPAIQQYPHRFQVVWHRPDPDTYILRVLPQE